MVKQTETLAVVFDNNNTVSVLSGVYVHVGGEVVVSMKGRVVCHAYPIEWKI